jgi:hypothetical protein
MVYLIFTGQASLLKINIMSFTTVAHCGTDHAAWLKSIEFYEGEFAILNKRLLEIASKNTGVEILSQVEHFQNQFIIQQNNMDELKHLIRGHDANVSADAKQHSGKMNTLMVGEHHEVREKFERVEKIINDLRQEFNVFLAKWM